MSGVGDPETVPIAEGVVRRGWKGPELESDVVFYRVEGGGHSWPGSAIRLPRLLMGRTNRFDATRAIWAFLSQHRREG